jgi:iron-sulfur cluster repair protein YtfE (RIC family)
LAKAGLALALYPAPKEEQTMDALELLKQDHAKVKELLEKAESAEGKERSAIFEKIKTELETHARIEENIFYPAVQKNEELKDMVLESLEEHKQVKTLLREMDSLSKESEKFEPKLKVLKENVEHHAEEEEEGKMFPKVRKLFSANELQELGAELEKAKGKQERKAS